VDRRNDLPDSELPPRKRLCLSTVDSRYEIGESSTARPTGGRGVDYGFVSIVDAEARQKGIREETVWIMEEEAYASREACAHSIGLSQAVHHELQTHRDHVYAHESQLHAHQTQLQLQGTLIQAQHQVHKTRSQMQLAEMAELRETDRKRKGQMVEIRREMGDMQAELLALQEQWRRARQPTPDARVPNHQDASRDADSHI
ncbi:hypothetical protein Tco_0096127, partial [Tanacetum coccineum]